MLAALRATAPRHSRWLPQSTAACKTALRFGGAARYKIRRVEYPWKAELERESWEFMRQEMVNFFASKPQRDSTVHVRGVEWPRYALKEDILERGRLPGLISRWGPQRRIVLDKSEMERIAFDEPQGHLSNLFKGRLFRIHVGKWIEECVAVDVASHPVEHELYFVRFARHVPGKMTTLPIPVSIVGLWGCPGYRKGGFVDLSMTTINVECVGETIPPPFLVDVSQLKLEAPYGTIRLRDIQHMLPADGTVRFSREYSLDEDVVMCYDPKSVPEVPLPSDWQDPNFDHRGGRYHLTYTGFWPRQIQRE
eukprot:gnl/TRDRNA2_/TRDRNA2_165894_c0_seq1.p1 gnl/TRDRNA2_/TRDRNA2_165894_c0~~gnl/TRDRNA2_/TRDRNA2_165894_c0_seq1.p1  ORF type:complete len:316 (-),score=32.15 gnl/TRDRNA2_/TRDRNA2_165894_c0_seq1:109-1032(-)